jgi:hypothetical protein
MATATLETTIRPGLLVGLSTSIKGNVKYNKTELEGERVEDGVLKSKWETEKTVINPAEHDAATKIRTKARGFITSVCSATQFGYLCPENKVEQLNAAIANARRVCDEFNRGSEVTTISFYAITGRVNPDDKEAVRAIKSEVSTLLAEMSDGVKNLDVEVIRGAAKRAKQIGSMLSPEAQARVQIAIDAARKKATEIKAAGEQAAVEIDRATLETLAEARTAFLDIDDAPEMVAPADTSGRAIDLTPCEPVVYDAANATGNFKDAGNFRLELEIG